MNRATARCLTIIAAMLVLLPLIVLGQQEEWTWKDRRVRPVRAANWQGFFENMPCGWLTVQETTRQT